MRVKKIEPKVLSIRFQVHSTVECAGFMNFFQLVWDHGLSQRCNNGNPETEVQGLKRFDICSTRSSVVCSCRSAGKVRLTLDILMTVWFLVGNGAMDYGDYYWGVYRDYYRDPFPLSLLSSRQISVTSSFSEVCCRNRQQPPRQNRLPKSPRHIKFFLIMIIV